MKKRSLFKKVFGDDKNTQYGTRLQLVNGYEAIFTNYDGNVYDSPTVRACIDAIARNAAKLNPKHIRSNDSNYRLLNENITYNKNEILDVKWFDIDYVLTNMDNDLRDLEAIKKPIINYKENNIGSINLVSEI